MTDSRTITLSSRVPPRAHGSLLLDWLSTRFRYHSRDEWAERIADGRVTVDGARVGAAARLVHGAVVGYARPAAEPDAPTDVRIVHDERGVVVIDKPAGLPFHADGAFVTRTVVATLARELGARLRPVQRLDRETSGLCVLARDRATARALHQQLEAGGFEKTYLALVRGVVPDDRFVVDAPIGRDASSRISLRRAVVDPDAEDAREAVTEFEVVSRGESTTLLRCVPRTGRTHQIRVHLESRGFALCGDKLYGRTDDEHLAWLTHVKAGGDAAWGGRLGAPRQMLHACALAFDDPVTGSRLRFSAAMPEDFAALVAGDRHPIRALSGASPAWVNRGDPDS